MVAKGVSPPNLGLWLLICLFSNKSAATWPRFCILVPTLVPLKSSAFIDYQTLIPQRTAIPKSAAEAS